MIDSLARCVKWNASGGKSGSAFLKTLGIEIGHACKISLTQDFPLDDRFIAKEMSKTEFQTMESFAPAYFAYMSSVVSANVSPLHLFCLLSLIENFSGQHFLRKCLVAIRSRLRNPAKINPTVDGSLHR